MKPFVIVSTKGQIVIPREVRERLGIRPGTKLRLRLCDTRIELWPIPSDLIGHLHGILKKGPSLTRMLLAERKADRDREERKAARLTRGAKVPAKRRRL